MRSAALEPSAIAIAIGAQVAVLRYPQSNAGVWLYGAAALLLMVGSRSEPASDPPEEAGSDRHDRIATAVLLAVATALRLVLLSQHPGIFGDEGERGMEARGILDGGRPPLFGYGWWGVPNLYFYLLAATLRLAGDGVFGLRLLSAASGVVTVFFVARTGRLLWGSRAGLLAGALLAVSPVALQFSRLAGESTPMGALWAAGFFFLLRCLPAPAVAGGDRLRQVSGDPVYLPASAVRDAVLAGVLLGGSLYFYAAAKLLLLLVPILALLLLATRPRAPRLVALVALSFGATFLPLAISSWKQPQAFAGRYQEASILSPQNRPIVFGEAGVPYSAEWRQETVLESVRRRPWSWTRVVLHQVMATLDVLYRHGDPTAFYQSDAHLGSLLSPLLSPAALLGLAFGLRNLGDRRFAIVALWFWGGLLAPVLTINTPSVQRLAGAWPALMLSTAVFLDHLARRAAAAGARRLASGALWAFTGTLAILDTRDYFVRYRALSPYGDSTAQARYVAALGATTKAYQLGIDGARYGDVFLGYGPTRFLARDVQGGDVGALPSRLPIADDDGKGAAFLVYPSNALFLPMLRLFYPEGREKVLRSGEKVWFTAYEVDAAVLARSRALRAVFTTAEGTRLERAVPSLGTVDERGSEAAWKPPEELVYAAYPVRSSWDGAFLAPESGPRRVTLRGAGDAALRVDGQLVAREDGAPGSAAPVTLFLARGLHEVRLEGSLVTPASRISVRLPAPLEPRLLFRSTMGGLSGEVWSGGSGLDSLPSRAPEARRVDPFLGFRYAHEDPGFPKDPFVVRWRATLRAPEPGTYVIGLRSNGPSRISLDGRTVLDVPARGDLTAPVALDAAPRSLEVRYAWTVERPYLELTWIPPGGAIELIPPGVLTPLWRSGLVHP